jgi:hypothetical protein
VSQPRYYFPVTALILLAAPFAAWAGTRARGLRSLATAAIAAVLFTVALSALNRAAGRWTRAHDTPIEYRFELRDESGRARIRCRTANAGIWAWSLKRDERPVSFFRPDPAPGDVAEAVCELPGGPSAVPAMLEIDVPELVSQGFVRLALGRNGESPTIVDSDQLIRGRPIDVPLSPGPSARVTVQLQAAPHSAGRGLGHSASMTLRLQEGTPATAASLLTASPNPIQVCDGSGLGATRLTWAAPADSLVEVRVNSIGGDLFWPASRGGDWRTGRWVANGTVFLLVVPASGGTPARAIRSVSVGVTRDGCR